MKKGNNHSKKLAVLLVEDSFINFGSYMNDAYQTIYRKENHSNIEVYRKDLSDRLKRKLENRVDIDISFDINSAINKLDSKNYDLVVSDIELPITVKLKRGFLPSCNQEYEKNQEYFDKLTKIFGKNSEYVVKHFKKIPCNELIIDFFEKELLKEKKRKFNEDSLSYTEYHMSCSYGLIVADKSKNKGIPTVLYSNIIGHGVLGIEKAFAGGFLSIEGIIKLYKIFRGILHVENERTIRKQDDFYLGPKRNLDNFAEVIKREIEQRK